MCFERTAKVEEGVKILCSWLHQFRSFHNARPKGAIHIHTNIHFNNLVSDSKTFTTHFSFSPRLPFYNLEFVRLYRKHIIIFWYANKLYSFDRCCCCCTGGARATSNNANAMIALTLQLSQQCISRLKLFTVSSLQTAFFDRRRRCRCLCMNWKKKKLFVFALAKIYHAILQSYIFWWF